LLNAHIGEKSRFFNDKLTHPDQDRFGLPILLPPDLKRVFHGDKGEVKYEVEGAIAVRRILNKFHLEQGDSAAMQLEVAFDDRTDLPSGAQ